MKPRVYLDASAIGDYFDDECRELADSYILEGAVSE